MSFTYEDFYLSGFNTGVTISGIQKQTPLYWTVTGLQYNGNPVTTGDFGWFTGVIIADSGTLTAQSGFMGFDSENDEYRGILTFDVASGLTATGCIELYWNSGSVYDTGYTLVSGFDTFSNKNEDAWNIITNIDNSVDNADDQHSHAGGVSYVSCDLNPYNGFDIVPGIGTNQLAVLHSDSDAGISFNGKIPSDGIWKAVVQHASSASARTDIITSSVRKLQFNDVSVVLTAFETTLVNTTLYVYYTGSTQATWTGSAGDTIAGYIQKSNDAGAGYLFIPSIWLEKVS